MGRKTQTRRILGHANNTMHLEVLGQELEKANKKVRWSVGDILYVRETFGWHNGKVIFKADYPDGKHPEGRGNWKPGIHLPKIHSRLKLEVTGVKVCKLYSMTEEDAINEGIDYRVKMCKRQYMDYMTELCFLDNPLTSFKTLWKSINGKDSWEENPIVAVISFKILSSTSNPK